MSPDGALDFLAAGETLTLTYTAEVDSNYAPDNLKTFQSVHDHDHRHQRCSGHYHRARKRRVFGG